MGGLGPVVVRKFLWAASGLSLAVAAVVVFLAAKTPLRSGAADAAPSGAATTRPTLPGDPAPLSSYAAAWSIDLRRSLTDAGKAASSQPGGGTNTLPVRLVGTILDPERPRGVFVTTLGQMELRGVGEKAGGVEVLKVDERSATLSISGQPVTIRVEKAELSVPGAAPATTPSARTGGAAAEVNVQ